MEEDIKIKLASLRISDQQGYKLACTHPYTPHLEGFLVPILGFTALIEHNQSQNEKIRHTDSTPIRGSHLVIEIVFLLDGD